MGLYVFLTAFLYQKGSAESKKLSGSEPVDRDPRRFKNKKHAPWPVKHGGFVLRLYENSLSLAFLLLFLVSFFLHALGGRGNYNEEQLLHGQPAVSLYGYMTSERFWFESFQNWQSEFLGDRRDGGLSHLPAPARLARVEAGRQSAWADFR